MTIVVTKATNVNDLKVDNKNTTVFIIDFKISDKDKSKIDVDAIIS